MASGLAAADEGPRLTGKELSPLLVGKTFVLRTDKTWVGPSESARIERRSDGGAAELTVFIRPDGSLRMRCTNIDRTGARSTCGRAVGGDVGVWEIRGDTFCMSMYIREGATQCYFVHRTGARHRFRQSSGPASTGDGAEFDVRP
jgi:hypothetical protein